MEKCMGALGAGVRHGVEGAIRKVWEIDKKFVRPSNDIVLRRDGGAYCLRTF
jgi:hypothetical protein